MEIVFGTSEVSARSLLPGGLAGDFKAEVSKDTDDKEQAKAKSGN